LATAPSQATLGLRRRLEGFPVGLDQAESRPVAEDPLEGVEQAEAEAAAMAELRGMEAGRTADDAEAPEEELDVSAELAELKRKLKK